MSLIPPEVIDQIIAANDVVDVIGSYFPLKRSGPVYKALCPFHQERTPSFTVNPQRQIFKCFGCGAGGSVIRFVQNYENLDFVGAAKKLAERAGIKLEESEMSAEDQARYSMRRRLLALHAEAADFFHWHLMKKPSAQIARDYLKSRGVSGEVAKSWKIGFAPDEWDAMRDFADSRGFNDEELVKSGLVKLRDEENPRSEFYDRFRARVMFPICNDTGEVIAFSGRVLEADAKAAKYVNSPETMLFTKGAVLFGLNKSKRALIDAKSAIVCEGQLDLITAFEAGVQNVIAPQGTAFTEKQARILKRFVDEVVLCFDADIAGEKAAERSLASLLAENLVVRVVEMPQGEDPDSMIRGKGPDAFRERITAAKDFFDFQFDRLASRPDFASARGKMQAARKMAESISLIRDAVLRETEMNRVTQRLEISAQEFVKLLRAPSSKSVEEPESSTKLALKEFDMTVSNLIFTALRDKETLDWLRSVEPTEAMFQYEGFGLLVKILNSDVDPDRPATVSAFQSHLPPEEEAIVANLLESGLRKADGSSKNDRLTHQLLRKASEPPPTQEPGRKQLSVVWDPLSVAQASWQDLTVRPLRERLEAVKARIRNPDLPIEDVSEMQKEILDLQKRLLDISRPLSPPL